MKDKDEIQEKALNGIGFEDKQLFLQHMLDKDPPFKERVEQIRKHLYETHSERKNIPSVAYLVVTHAPIVKNLICSFIEAYQPNLTVKKIFPSYSIGERLF